MTQALDYKTKLHKFEIEDDNKTQLETVVVNRMFKQRRRNRTESLSPKILKTHQLSQVLCSAVSRANDQKNK